MAQVDFHRREIAIKLVYYGPALSGKTTNLQKIHAHLDPRRRSRLLSLDTNDDRTLFFDLLPLSFRASTGGAVKVKLFTVPGQVIHNTTRRLVLQNCDGVAFVADSQVAQTQQNNESFADLQTNLRENQLNEEEIPVVIQFNKRDLPDVRSDEDLRRIAARGKETIFPAVALTGQGVLETLLGLAEATWDALERRIALGSKHQIAKQEFLGALAVQVGLAAPEVRS